MGIDAQPFPPVDRNRGDPDLEVYESIANTLCWVLQLETPIVYVGVKYLGETMVGSAERLGIR